MNITNGVITLGFKKTCCFTGHRELSGDVFAIRDEVYETILWLADSRGIENFIAGGALGFDMLAAEAVLAAKYELPVLKLALALPFRDYRSRWPEDMVRRMDGIIERADAVRYVTEDMTGVTARDALLGRNRYMVDRASVCVAYLKNQRGGTAYTVSYAKKRGTEVFYIGA